MKKKLSLLLCLMFAASTMTACGSDPTKVDYYGTTYSELTSETAAMSEAIVAPTMDNIMSFAPLMETENGEELLMEMSEGWSTSVEGLGECQGLGDVTVTKANGTVTVDQLMEFEGREVDITYVYNYDYEEEALVITDVTVDLVYTMGEKMAKAGLNTLMGMGTVFCVLILISLIISCFKIIPYLTERKNKETASKEEAVQTAEPVQEVVLTDDLELVAVISAAIAASTGTSTDSFVVRSITRR